MKVGKMVSNRKELGGSVGRLEEEKVSFKESCFCQNFQNTGVWKLSRCWICACVTLGVDTSPD